MTGSKNANSRENVVGKRLGEDTPDADKTPHVVMQESAEMYLETILILQNEGMAVRAIDIANRMGHARATVSEWMKKLVAGDYLTIDAHGIISFTDAGRAQAVRIYERHVLLTELFKSVGVTPEIAMRDACRVEHYISDETFACLRDHYRLHVPVEGTDGNVQDAK